MKMIQITLNLTDELAIKSIFIDENDTGLPNDTTLLENVAIGLIKVINKNRKDLQIQDLLYEANINRP